jgi:phospholipase C
MFEGNKHYVSNFARRLPGDRMKLQRVMDYFGADQLPAYAALAESFGICDRWYCSHVGPTWPNRFVTFTGDLNLDHLGEPERNQPDLAHLIPITRKTVFDHLSDRGVSWKVYEHGYSFLRLYGKYTFDTTNVTSFTDPTRGFVADARAGRLPQVTFIEPDYIDLPPGNDDHPPGDMADGQRLVATIASALMESPQWERTLFVITYDEAGGFYDHHVPGHGPPLFGGLTQYGPRVPTFVVSPLVAARSVSHTVYDHTTIISTILRRFCSPNPPHMSPRADAAADLRDMILPAARPRSEFAALRERLVAVRNTPPTPRIAPPKLKRWTEGDDFHTLLGYVRSLT